MDRVVLTVLPCSIAIDGGMPFSTKLMEGFHFIGSKVDGGIPVYSLGIRCAGFNYVDTGVPCHSLYTRWRDADEIDGGIFIRFYRL